MADTVITSHHLIGLCGFGGVGKDTVAAMLCQMYGFTQAAFADNVRAMAREINSYFPLLKEDYVSLVDRLGYDKAKRDHTEVREYLVRIGHATRKVLGAGIWLDSVLPPPGSGREIPTTLVVSDVRYPNEADRVRALGGLVWRIDRPGFGPAHPTEGATIAETHCDVILVNDGSVEELRAHVVRLMEQGLQ